jgi:hypothetical protein
MTSQNPHLFDASDDGNEADAKRKMNFLSGSKIGTVTYFAGSGTPVGSQTPNQIGDQYVDYTNGLNYIATGITNADWASCDGPSSLDAASVKVVANANPIAGISGIIRVNVADASADTDVTMTHKVRVIDAWFLNTGIAAHGTDDTITFKNTANAITDTIAKTATVNAVKRASTINPAYHEIAAGGKLRITAVKATNAAVTAYAHVIRVA